LVSRGGGWSDVLFYLGSKCLPSLPVRPVNEVGLESFSSVVVESVFLCFLPKPLKCESTILFI